MLDFYDNVYDVQTPYVEGFFGENDIDGKMLYSYDFKIRNKNYSISFLKSKNKKEVMDIIASIQPVDNIEASYKTASASYENKETSNYPEEMLLVSMISIKGINITDLRKLLKIMEEKKYHEITIGDIRKEIEFLEGKS